MRAAGWLVEENGSAARAVVGVVGAEDGLIGGRKIACDGQARCGAEFYGAVAVVGAAGVGVEGAIAGEEVQVAGGVRGGSAASHPDAGVIAVGIGVEGG